MPIPGDNGNPKQEREKQNMRIEEESKTAGDVKSELRFNKPEGKKETYLGRIG
jgi:hypothetical protein